MISSAGLIIIYMKKITIAREFADKIGEFQGLAISCDVENTEPSFELWAEMDAFIAEYSSSHEMTDINKNEHIDATRKAYKALGKDPNRYRPSAEALKRRIMKEKSLYKIDTLVDLINYVSLKTGFSIGGFDEDKISGDSLELGVGREGEAFTAIGRGTLNIDCLPIYRDLVGGIGTPTSDEERTKISLSTKRILILVNGYSGSGITEAESMFLDLLKRYAKAENFEIIRYGISVE